MSNIKIFGKNSEPIPISGSGYNELRQYINYKLDRVMEEFRIKLKGKK